MMMEYFSRKEVSNSDLSWLKSQIHPIEMADSKQAFRLGTLIDGMLTENESNIDYFKMTCFGERYTKQEFNLAEKMKNAFLKDDLCMNILKMSKPQIIDTATLNLNYCNKLDFKIQARCKWDLKTDVLLGADIKSTTAKTQKEFESAFKFFDYHRQRAFYMDISNHEEDVVIGISKNNFKIFKVYIKRDSELYKQGKAEYTYLAFKWNLLFGETKF